MENNTRRYVLGTALLALPALALAPPTQNAPPTKRELALVDLIRGNREIISAQQKVIEALCDICENKTGEI